jgi:hypothetical protein
VARGATGTARKALPPSREKEKEMRNKFRIIGVSLAAMAGLLLVSGVAWANPNKEPVSGEVVSYLLTDPGEIWVDDDGVWHRRNQWARARWEGDIEGRMVVVVSSNIDPSTEDGDQHGSFIFNGYVGEDWVSATGRFSGVRSGPPITWEVDHVWHLDDGRLIKTTGLTTGGFPGDYVGEILDPPGRR